MSSNQISPVISLREIRNSLLSKDDSSYFFDSEIDADEESDEHGNSPLDYDVSQEIMTQLRKLTQENESLLEQLALTTQERDELKQKSNQIPQDRPPFTVMSSVQKLIAPRADESIQPQMHFQKEIIKLQLENKTLRDEMAKMEVSLTRHESNHASRNDEISQLRNETMSLLGQISSLLKERSSLTTQLGETQALLSKIQGEVNLLQSKLKMEEKKNTEKHCIIRNLQSEKNLLREEKSQAVAALLEYKTNRKNFFQIELLDKRNSSSFFSSSEKVNLSLFSNGQDSMLSIERANKKQENILLRKITLIEEAPEEKDDRSHSKVSLFSFHSRSHFNSRKRNALRVTFYSFGLQQIELFFPNKEDLSDFLEFYDLLMSKINVTGTLGLPHQGEMLDSALDCFLMGEVEEPNDELLYHESAVANVSENFFDASPRYSTTPSPKGNAKESNNELINGLKQLYNLSPDQKLDESLLDESSSSKCDETDSQF